jgi:transcriptional regulator with XRE-family HTH domain
MNTTFVKREILNSLRADPEYRHAWNLENVYTGICFQIRALREQREFSQSALGKEAKMAQERISILEDPNADTRPTLNTLLRLADAFDVGLDVRFVPYGTVIDRSTKTDMKRLEVPSFEDEFPELERGLMFEAEHSTAKRRTRRKFRASGRPTPTVRRTARNHRRRSLASKAHREQPSREYAAATPTAIAANSMSRGLALARGYDNAGYPGVNRYDR